MLSNGHFRCSDALVMYVNDEPVERIVLYAYSVMQDSLDEVEVEELV